MDSRVPRAYIISPELKPSVPQRGGSKIEYFTLKVLNLLRKFRGAAEAKLLDLGQVCQDLNLLRKSCHASGPKVLKCFIFKLVKLFCFIIASLFKTFASEVGSATIYKPEVLC